MKNRKNPSLGAQIAKQNVVGNGRLEELGSEWGVSGE